MRSSQAAGETNFIGARLEVGDRIGAFADRQNKGIAAQPARERVIAESAAQSIVAIVAKQGIIAIVAEEDVIVVAASKGIVTGCALNRLDAVAAIEIQPKLNRQGVGGGVGIDAAVGRAAIVLHAEGESGGVGRRGRDGGEGGRGVLQLVRCDIGHSDRLIQGDIDPIERESPDRG